MPLIASSPTSNGKSVTLSASLGRFSPTQRPRSGCECCWHAPRSDRRRCGAWTCDRCGNGKTRCWSRFRCSRVFSGRGGATLETIYACRHWSEPDNGFRSSGSRSCRTHQEKCRRRGALCYSRKSPLEFSQSEFISSPVRSRGAIFRTGMELAKIRRPALSSRRNFEGPWVWSAQAIGIFAGRNSFGG